MAIKCFKHENNSKAYIDSKHICYVREWSDGETEIATVDGGSTYVKQSVESVVSWWKKQQETDVKEPKFKEVDDVYTISLANINNRRYHVVEALKEVLNFHLDEKRSLGESSRLTVLITRNKVEAMEVWAKLKARLFCVGVNVILEIDSVREQTTRW